jgi:hypothetical protein
MIALILALAVISGCLIPWAVRADGADYHLIHRSDCADCEDRP